MLRKRESGAAFGLSALACTAMLSLSLCLSQPAAHAESPLQRGCNQMTQKRFNEAVMSFSESISSNNSDAIAYFRRGQCFYILQNYKNALTDFDRAISFEDQIPSFFLWRGTCHAKMGDDSMAILDYERAMRLDPQLVTNFNKEGGKIKQLPSTTTKDEDKTALISSKSGRSDSVNLGYSEKAVADYAEAVKRASPSTIGYIKAGSSYNGLVEVGVDGKRSETFPATPSGDGVAAIKYGEMYWQLKNPKRDLTVLEQELTSRPADPKLYYEQGRAYQQLHDNEKALADFNRAIDLDRNSAQYLLARAFLYHQQGKNDLVEADIKSAQDVDPSLPRTIKFGVPSASGENTAKKE